MLHLQLLQLFPSTKKPFFLSLQIEGCSYFFLNWLDVGRKQQKFHWGEVERRSLQTLCWQKFKKWKQTAKKVIISGLVSSSSFMQGLNCGNQRLGMFFCHQGGSYRIFLEANSRCCTCNCCSLFLQQKTLSFTLQIGGCTDSYFLLNWLDVGRRQQKFHWREIGGKMGRVGGGVTACWRDVSRGCLLPGMLTKREHWNTKQKIVYQHQIQISRYLI